MRSGAPVVNYIDDEVIVSERDADRGVRSD
jgi:hypothetical protein